MYPNIAAVYMLSLALAKLYLLFQMLLILCLRTRLRS